MFHIRPVRADDSQAILSIYTPYIRTTAITFETEVPTPEAFAERVAAIAARYPYYVCEEDGAILGYAYASAFHPRAAYRFDAELSVYLRKDCIGRKIGTALYEKLLQSLKERGFCNLYALITLPNDASLALHRFFGFTEAGIWHRTGYKNGAWHDVAVLEKQLNDYQIPPREPDFGKA